MGLEDAPPPPAASAKKTVCVTGATGFIGSHLVKQLLEKGYSVRGTVLGDVTPQNGGWLHELAKGTPGSLELVSADLMTPGTFDEAVRGCALVCHLAAIVCLDTSVPARAIVDAAVEGTRNVLGSVLKAKEAKRVVLASSSVAVVDMSIPPGHVFTEQDWQRSATLDLPYAMGKTLAERHAWRVHEEVEGKQAEEGWGFELVALLPTFVMGPMLHSDHAKGTNTTVRDMLGGMPLVPDINYNVVDVRDVAGAFVTCLENDSAKGRYLIAQEGLNLTSMEMAEMLHKRYPGVPAPVGTLPAWTLLLMAYLGLLPFSPAVVQLVAGCHCLCDTTKAKRDLGLALRPVGETVLDAAASLVAFKVVPEPSSEPKQPWLPALFPGATVPAPDPRGQVPKGAEATKASWLGFLGASQGKASEKSMGAEGAEAAKASWFAFLGAGKGNASEKGMAGDGTGSPPAPPGAGDPAALWAWLASLGAGQAKASAAGGSSEEAGKGDARLVSMN